MRDGRSGMNRPTFILEKKKLKANLTHFTYLTKETGIKWLYTLKAFDKPEGLALIAESIDGFSIGNSNEYSKVKHHYKNLHSYAPAFYEDEVETLAQESTTMSFNSLSQWQRYANKCAKHCSLGLRINPHLILKQPSYCDSNISRLGIHYKDFLAQHHTFKGLEGLHFHALCHQTLPALEKLFNHIETHYQEILPKLKWLNLGGGQNFTDTSYNNEGFISLIEKFRNKYPHLTLYFEPGSAVVHNCGYFECTVMDIIESDTPIVILNTSIEAHLLDVAITKQKPKVRDTSLIKTEYHYELTGMSCIAGDVIGKYYFKSKLKVGDKIIFEDMLGYTMVKQTSFNGLKEVRFKIT
jgi:carboxynorspermidine decarboxylase